MHAIDQTVDKQGAFAHVDEGKGSIWHTLGHPIKQGASAKEIGKVASLNWRVRTAPVLFQRREVNGAPDIATDGNHQVMFRSDTDMVLDITGKGYIPHQNEEVLEFFQEYIDAGSMFIDTAGSLMEGRYIFVQAKIGEAFDLGGGDKVQGRVLLMNPHQYGKGMIGKIVHQRVVCWNTLQAALTEGGKTISIPHTRVFDRARREQAKKNLGIAAERVYAFQQDAKKLVKLQLETPQALELLIEVFDGKPKMPLEQQGRTITRLMELYEGAGIGAGMKTAFKTGWGLLNAVTQYYDHDYGRTVQSRAESAILGIGDIKKRETFKALLAIAA